MRRALRSRDERAMTLVEVMVAMVLMTAIVGIAGPVMVGAMSATGRVELESQSIDELRQTIVSIGRELRSAQCIWAPAIANGATSATGNVLDFTTQANNESVPYRVSYTYAAGKLTRTRNGVSNIVANHLTAGQFVQFSTPRRSVSLSFTVRTSSRLRPHSITTTIAGRNAWVTCVP